LKTERVSRSAPTIRERPPTRIAITRKLEIRRKRVEKYTTGFTINGGEAGVNPAIAGVSSRR
jgi:hypothetical protein